MSEPFDDERPRYERGKKAPDVVVVERDITPDDELEDDLDVEDEYTLEKKAEILRNDEEARRLRRHAEMIEEDRDASDALREEMDTLYPSVPPEVDQGIGGPVERNTWWAARTFGAMRTEAGIVSIPKWLGYKGSSILTSIETWGKDAMKKNSPWIGKVPVVGTWLLSDVKKSWEERDKEDKKKKEGDEKKNKGDKEKAKKADEKKKKDSEAALKKSQDVAGKKTQAQDKIDDGVRQRHELELSNFIMSPKEKYDFLNGDDDTKKAILEKAEAEYPAYQERQKERVREEMLTYYMSVEEKDFMSKPVAYDGDLKTLPDDEREVVLKELAKWRADRVALLNDVENQTHLPWRQQLAEERRTFQKPKAPGGGGKGKGKGKGGGRS
ncbi:MAG: hypothetical protein NTX72_02050 [Candidatus Uhrbacteria bacterium]|nr:hypothetical protein [Candidatus Uhrbacteria bacterium]